MSSGSTFMARCLEHFFLLSCCFPLRPRVRGPRCRLWSGDRYCHCRHTSRFAIPREKALCCLLHGRLSIFRCKHGAYSQELQSIKHTVIGSALLVFQQSCLFLVPRLRRYYETELEAALVHIALRRAMSPKPVCYFIKERQKDQ